MKSQILGDDIQIVVAELNAGELIQAESGKMFYFEGNVEIDSRVPGGWVGGLKRMFVGESFFLTTFHAKENNAKVAFSSAYPGKIFEVEISESNSWQAQKSSFLFSHGNIKIDIALVKKFKAGFFGGEGFIMQKFTGIGKLFLTCGGMIIEKTLAPDEIIHVDTGCVVAFEDSVTYDVTPMKSIKTVLFAGEGLFLTTLKGPGKVILQSLPLSRLREVVLTGVAKNGILSDVGKIFAGGE